MNQERLEELAALHAAGALDGAERAEFERLLAAGDPAARRAAARFADVAALVALAGAAAVEPAPAVRARVLARVRPGPPAPAPAVAAGFKFIAGTAADGWQQLPVPGASVKLLSLDAARGYAVVLGRLAAGASYPPHTHLHAEQVYVLEGDLHIGAHAMKAGDFHEADAGTRHDVNYSESGCTILAVISVADLQAQLQPAG